MFTGIVREKGKIHKVRGNGLLELDIEAPDTASELRVGDSVAVNGVCLTATRVRKRRFRVQAMAETLARTTLGGTRSGQPVNLETAARLGDRIGGHLVQGHVDAVGNVEQVTDEGGSLRVRLRVDPEVVRYLAPKGSVTLDGVSLTITDVDDESFEVALIPHTLEATTLREVSAGDCLNVEVDVLARYVERLMGRGNTGE